MSRIVNSVMSSMAIAFAGSGRTEASAPRPRSTPRNRLSFVCLSLLLTMSAVAAPAFAQNNTLRVNKAFNPSPVAAGATSQMTITLYNTDTAGPQTDVIVTDIFPTGLNWTGVVSNTCGGSPNTPGPSLILNNATIPAATGSGASSCTLVVSVTATAVGEYTNTIPASGATGKVNGGATHNASAVSSTLSVQTNAISPVNGTKAFSPSTMAQGQVGSFTIRINNPNAFDISGVAVADNLASGGNITSTPAGGSLSPTGITANTCGGSPGISGSTVSLSGGSIAAGDFCTITVSFIASQSGTYTNTLLKDAITVGSHAGLNSTTPISADLAVQDSAVTVGKAFDGEEAVYPDWFVMTLSFANLTSSAVQGLAITDAFADSNSNGNPDLVVSEVGPQVVENTCGGTFAPAPLATSVSLTGGTIPANGSCQIRVRVRASENGVADFTHTNVTRDCSGSLVGGGSFNCPIASDFITLRGNDGGDAMVVGLNKAYLSTDVDTGTVVRGRIMLMTPESTDIVNYSLPDTFQASTTQGASSDVVLAPTAGNFTFQDCGASAAATPLAGGNGFTLNGITIRALSGGYGGGTAGWTNPACVIEFDVVGNVPGAHVNTIPIDQGTGRRATDASTVVRAALNRQVSADFIYRSPLSATKGFSPAVVSAGGLSRLTITLSNSNDLASIANLSFTDNLPSAGAGVEVLVAPAANISNTCGGILTAAPGSGTVSLSGGALLAGSVGGVPGLCEVSLDVVINDTVDGIHDFLNRIPAGAVSGNIAGNRVTNNADVDAPVYARALGMTVAKSFLPAQIDGGETSQVTITITNPNSGGWVINAIAMTDNLPTGMVVADIANPSTTCTANGQTGGTPATVTAAPGAGSFTLNNAALYGSAGGAPAGGMSACTVTVTVRALISDNLINTIALGDVTSAGGATNTNAYSATLVVLPSTTVSKRFIPDIIPVGGISELEIEVLNANGDSATNIRIQDAMPSEVLIADPLVWSPVDTCPGLNVIATPGSSLLQAEGLNLAANERCRFRVRVTSLTPGTFTNTIASNQVGSDQGGIRTENATDDLTVTNGPTVAKSFADDSFASGGTTQLTMRVTNPATGGTPLTNVVFVDNLPAGMTLANPVNLATSGACGTGTVTATAGAGVVTWSGGTLAGNAFCEIIVDVTATTVGTYTNILPACDLNATPPVAGSTAAATGNDGSSVTCNTAGAEDVVEVVALNLGFTKTLSAENGAVAGIAEPGEQLTYTIAVTNSSSSDANAIPVVDVVPANTTFVSADNGGVLNGGQVDWTVNVPANSTVNIQVVFQVVDPLPAGVTSIANSATVNGQTCATVPCVETPTQLPTLVLTKSVTTESGTTAGIAEAGEQITYTINVANTTGVDAAGVSIVDVVPANTTFVSAGNGGVLNGNQVEWTQNVPANNSVQVTVTFAVANPIPAGVTFIANNATANGQGCATNPCVETPVATPEFTISKALTAENGVTAGVAEAGEQLTYTLTVANTSNANAANVLVADVVPANTTFVSADSGGVLNGNQVQWTLPIPANSSITLSVVFAIDDPLPDGVTSIANNATVEGQGCATTPCVETPVGRPELGFIKTLSAEGGSYPGVVEPGEQLTYTVTVENTGNATAVNVPVIDTLPAEVTFVSADNGGTFSGGLVNWTIASIAPGNSVVLNVVVRAPAVFPAGTTRIVNNATVDGETCTTQPCVETPVARPPTAIDDDGGLNQVGLAVTLATPNNDLPATAPLDPTSVWIVGTSRPNVSLPVPGEGIWSVNPTTGQITFTPEAGFSGNPTPIRYTIADTLGLRSNEAVETLEYTQDLLLRLSKKASVRTVVIGDLVQYTLTIENIGDIDVVDATVQDLPPNGFTFVPGSLRVLDKDNNGTLVSSAPLRIAEVDVDRGDTATITYLMAVGAGTLPGTHTNTAIVLSNEVPISNEASATVVSTADPLLEQSLIIGTVFNDRDSDAWQDSAKASGLRVSGGIDESVYVAGSTTVDYGQGPQAQADASAPLNHGLKLGTLDGRNTAAQAEDAHRIVISQRLREARFAEGFTLVTDEGSTVRMDAAGKVSTERSGDAAKGLTAQDVRVERKVTPVDGQFQVDYVISNAGIDERGIPGVRIGTVEGLLIETDGHGRFHLEGITPSHYARGSNFVMKVDTATLPRGSVFTTENPRVKRVTQGVMTRFDFGVKVPETVIEGGQKTLDMSLGEVVFEANSAVVRPQYAPVIEHMAGEVRKHGGGEVEIAGFGGTPELALARAKAVHEALLARLPADIGQRVQVKVRGEVDGAEVLTYGHRISLGEVFFDTDKSTVKPAYASVIDKVAAEIEAGRVSELLITGHTDKRASDAYNLALGKRRAEAVYQAISRQLSPERRATLKVQYLPTSSADAPYESARGQ